MPKNANKTAITFGSRGAKPRKLALGIGNKGRKISENFSENFGGVSLRNTHDSGVEIEVESVVVGGGMKDDFLRKNREFVENQLFEKELQVDTRRRRQKALLEGIGEIKAELEG